MYGEFLYVEEPIESRECLNFARFFNRMNMKDLVNTMIRVHITKDIFEIKLVEEEVEDCANRLLCRKCAVSLVMNVDTNDMEDDFDESFINGDIQRFLAKDLKLNSNLNFKSCRCCASYIIDKST